MELRIVYGYWRLGAGAPAWRRNDQLPDVLVQLPLFNEPSVAVQLLNAAARLDYPRGQLRVQVLDDSTDDTPQIIAAHLALIDPDRTLFDHIRRPDRSGYKAGALQYGLGLNIAPFVAIFDADFVPPPDFLLQALRDQSPFHDANVAFLQGRWTYYNRNANLLTRVQSVLIDRHFFVQKPFQQAGGRVVHFNGSGGIWRRSAIDAAGGWTADTLCEDLDLSYRCALLSMNGVYNPALTCPSEIPQDLTAFKLQQRRWAKGSAQVAAKLIGKVARSGRGHIDDLHVLLGYLIHPLLLAFTLLWPWVVMAGTSTPMLWTLQGALILGNVAAFVGLMTTFRARGDARGPAWQGVLDVAGAMVVGVSLMVNNAIAFCSGLFKPHGIFERTPKGNQAAKAKGPWHWTVWAETALAIYGLGAGTLLFAQGHYIWGQQSFFMGCIMTYAVLLQIMPPLRKPNASPAMSSDSQ